MAKTPVVDVVGQGEATASPDLCRLSLTVSVTRAEARDALDAAASLVRAVLDVCDRHDIAAVDRQTSRLVVQPSWRWVDNSQELEGQVAAQSVQVTVRDLDDVGTLLAEVVDAGGSDAGVGNFSWDLADPEPLRREARSKAVEDARSKATDLAEALGLSLGDVRLVTDSSVGNGGAPVQMMAMKAGGAAPMEVSAGEVSVGAAVRVVWSLRDQ